MKEEAKAIVERFIPFCRQFDYSIGWIDDKATAKQAAIEALKMVIETLESMKSTEHSDNFWTLENQLLKTQQLIKEIEKL